MNDGNDKSYSYSVDRQDVRNSYDEDDENEEEEEDIDNEGNNVDNDEDDDDEDDDDGGNGVQRISKDDYEYGGEEDGNDDKFGDLEKRTKKRKLKTLLSSYEFAPRLAAPPSTSSSAPAPPPPPAPKPSYGGRNPLTDWTEHETFILLDAWGDRFLKQGRKSLRSEEWQEVAKNVTQESNIERTDTQCRNRLDTLKKKYKKEKVKLGDSEWVYFKKMDELLCPPPQKAGLSGEMDGESLFMNPKVLLNHSRLDETRDSPGNSTHTRVGKDEPLDSLPPQRTRNGRVRGNATSYKLLADSIQKFSEVYLKIETSKRQQMLELEKMRMDFLRDLEFQKKQILERTQAEILKIRRGEDDDDVNDGSV